MPEYMRGIACAFIYDITLLFFEEDMMAVRTMIKNSEKSLVIVETVSDFMMSDNKARNSNGNLVHVEDFPKLFESSEFLRAVEDTEHYKIHGMLSFWTGTLGMSLEFGDYRINPLGKNLEEMYLRVSTDHREHALPVPFRKRARVNGGVMPVIATVFGAQAFTKGPVFRLELDGSSKVNLEVKAPVVIFEQRDKKMAEQGARTGGAYHNGSAFVANLQSATMETFRGRE